MGKGGRGGRNSCSQVDPRQTPNQNQPPTRTMPDVERPGRARARGRRRKLRVGRGGARRAASSSRVRDGLEEAELAATWNQRKRKRRGTEDRIFQNEILRIASCVSMYKLLQYLTLEWHRFIKNIFPNSCTETSFYPSTSTIKTMTARPN